PNTPLADGTTPKKYAENSNKFVAIGSGGTTSAIPLDIKTLSLPSVIYQDRVTLPLSTIGGKGTITWSLLPGPAPADFKLPMCPASWLSLQPTTGSSVGLVVNKPDVLGFCMVGLQVADQSIAFNNAG